MSFFQNTCKPSGLGGRLMVKMMNSGHAKLADWGFSQIQAKADARVLDAGCGGGANVAVWLKQCPKGMDYSEISVAETRKINDAAIKAGRCDVVQGNAAAMPFQAETIISIQAFIDMPADDLDQIEDQVVVFRAREQAVAEVVAHERLLAQRE